MDEDRKVLYAAVEELMNRSKLSLEHPLDRRRTVEVLKILVDANLNIGSSDVRESFEYNEWSLNTPARVETLFDALQCKARPPAHFSPQDLEPTPLCRTFGRN